MVYFQVILDFDTSRKDTFNFINPIMVYFQMIPDIDTSRNTSFHVQNQNLAYLKPTTFDATFYS